MKSATQKQVVVVSLIILVLAAASFLLFYYGRQHRVIIDNRAVEIGERNYRSLAGVLVAVNHPTLDREAVLYTSPPPDQRPMLSFKFWPSHDFSTIKAVEMLPRERIMVKVVGPKFNLKAEAFDRMGDPVGRIDTDIHLGTKRNAMVRLVKIFNDLPEALEEYPDQALPQPTKEEEVPTGGSEGLLIGDDSPVPGADGLSAP